MTNQARTELLKAIAEMILPVSSCQSLPGDAASIQPVTFPQPRRHIFLRDVADILADQ